MSYIMGLDIGIGSIGLCVISGKGENAKIEHIATRIFDSGELDRGKSRRSQKRRGFRGSRRLIRRRSYRKLLVENHLRRIGLVKDGFETRLEDIKNQDVHLLKVKGISEKLTIEELYKCLVHTCNHRGYRDFYENQESENEEDGKNKTAVQKFDKLFKESGCRTVSEYLIKEYQHMGGIKFRNIDSNKENYLLIRRELLQNEVQMILNCQKAYYTELTEVDCAILEKIIFNQRDFEDGPGNPEEKYRRYTGFLETLGQCPFYPDLQRGFRGTVISDIFSVVNTLSQYRYVNNATGELGFSKEVAQSIILHVLHVGNAKISDIKKY